MTRTDVRGFLPKKASRFCYTSVVKLWSIIRDFVVRYERHISVLSMVGGFVLDNLALSRADLPFETYLLYVYLSLIGICILIVHLVEEGVWKAKLFSLARPWLLIALQFVSGSMVSAFLVFYSRAASLSATWPFLILLLAIFAGTELFKRYQDRLGYQCAIFFFGIFSFSVYEVPIMIGKVGTDVFLLAGTIAVVIFALFCLALLVTGQKRFTAAAPRVFSGAAAVFIILNVLYFTHLLPPLPLALRDVGVYHSLVRTADGYAVSGEPEPLIDDLLGVAHVHVLAGGPVFVFSSVFTPVAIQTDIVHRWEHWDGAENRWVVSAVVGFPVTGGRDGGYRGFSEIDGIPEGQWRVSIETPAGAVIGRIAFDVTYVTTAPPLSAASL